jgi:hypothetical protein
MLLAERPPQMNDRTPTRCSDEFLRSVLHETANWTVNGPNGQILCEVASLHCAVEQAVEFGALGHGIVALVHDGDPKIVLFSGQIRTLVDRLFDPEDYLIALYAMKA